MAIKPDMKKTFAERLRFSGLDKAQLQEAAQVAATLNSGGLNIHDVFPNGIVAPDSVTLKGEIAASQIDLLKDILLHPKVGGINVFPRGIPVIDRYRVNVTIR